MLIGICDPPHLSRSGDWHYRSDSPGRALAMLPDLYVINFDSLHPRRDELLLRADVAVLINVCDADLLPIVHARKSARRITVFEINDDVSAVQPWNTAYDFYRQRESFTLFLQLAHLCDGLQLSVPELARLYGYLNAHPIVFPNQLSHVSPFVLRATGKFTIGWGGSHGHLQDVARVAPALIDFVNTHHARLAIMGAETIWKLFDALPATKKSYTPPGTVEDYYAFVRTLDVGLAPIEDTAFNRCRSDVKFLEYAANGAVGVVQRSPVYASVLHGDTGFVFGSNEELVAVLSELEDAALRARIAERAHEYVRSQRLESAHAPSRLAYYRSLGAESTATLDDRYVELRAGRFQELLHEGIAQRANPEHAARLFAEAQRLEPTSYVPSLFTGIVRGDAASYAAALEHNPRSARATLGLAIAEARAGQVSMALGRLAALGEALPGYDAPFLRAAQLLESSGGTRDAELFRTHAHALVEPLWPSWRAVE